MMLLGNPCKQERFRGPHKYLEAKAHFALAEKVLRAPAFAVPKNLHEGEVYVVPGFDGSITAVRGNSSHVKPAGPHAGTTPSIVLTFDCMRRKDDTPLTVRKLMDPGEGGHQGASFRDVCKSASDQY